MVRRHSTSAGAQQFRDLLDEEDVIARIVRLVYETYGLGALPQAWDEFRCFDTENDKGTLLEFSSECPFMEQFMSWLTHTWTPECLWEIPRKITVFDQVPAQTFLALNPDLDPLLGKYLNACVASPFSFFEISSSEFGRGFTCCDLICGGQELVVESTASTLLHASQVLYARIVQVDGVAILDAAAPWPLPEDVKPAILALRDAIVRHPSSISPAHARQRLSAHELDVRSYYWGLMEQSLWDDSSRQPALSAMNGLH